MLSKTFLTDIFLCIASKFSILSKFSRFVAPETQTYVQIFFTHNTLIYHERFFLQNHHGRQTAKIRQQARQTLACFPLLVQLVPAKWMAESIVTYEVPKVLVQSNPLLENKNIVNVRFHSLVWLDRYSVLQNVKFRIAWINDVPRSRFSQIHARYFSLSKSG